MRQAALELFPCALATSTSEAKLRAAGKDLGGRRPTFIDDQIHSAVRLVEPGKLASRVARVLGRARPPSAAASEGCREGGNPFTSRGALVDHGDDPYW